MLDRLFLHIADEVLAELLRGFRGGSSKMDIIFQPGISLETCIEEGIDF